MIVHKNCIRTSIQVCIRVATRNFNLSPTFLVFHDDSESKIATLFEVSVQQHHFYELYTKPSIHAIQLITTL